jgi:DNA-binding XRE family transcriptional regulator
MKNRVKQLRQQNKLSQRKLAELVGTNQQQIQRIETGQVAARLAIAQKLSAVLKQPLDVVFPGSQKALSRVEAALKTSRTISEKELAEVAEHGVEADHRTWFFRLLLQQHTEPLVFPISGDDRRRLYTAVQERSGDDTEVRFVVFDTLTERIALNLAEYSFCQFLFEVGDIENDPDEAEREDIHVYFSANPTPFSFPPEVDAREDDEDLGEFEYLFATLSTYTEKYDRLHFTDGDGEEVFLCAGNLALLRVPLWVFATEGDSDEDQKPDLRLVKS